MLGRKLNPDATAAMKALTIYSLLIFSGRRYSLTELKDLLNCSKQTVGRLITQIETTPGLHVKIDIQEEGKEHYYQAQRPKTRPNASLQAKALQDLALCRDMVAHLLPPDLCRDIAATVNQTTVLLQDYDQREDALRPLPLATTTGAVDYSKHQDILATVLDGLRQHHIIEIHYQAHDRAEAKTLAIAPLTLITQHPVVARHRRLRRQNG